MTAVLIAIALSVPAVLPATALAGKDEPRERGSGPERGALMVKLQPGASEAAAAAAVAAVGGSEIGRLDELSTRVIKVPPGQAKKARERLLADPAVVSVEEDGEAQATLVPNDALWSKQWFARKVRGPSAWDVTTGGSGPIIAVLDTGVAGNHPDLRGRMVGGWNFHANSSNTADDGNHGTAVAGVAAGAGNNGIGIAGVCWKCRIMPVKVLNSSGSGSWSNVAAGIVWATNRGARVINLSLGGPTGSAALGDAVKYAIGRGVVVVAAAGNNGSSKLFYPAAYPNVISVAATTSADQLYSFSNRGSWVDIAAPGCTWTTAPGAKWRSFCGTSAAAPVVAGAAALVLSRSPVASRLTVQRAMTATAVRFTSAISGGRLNVGAAVRQLGTSVTNPDPAPTATAPTATASPKPTATASPKPTATASPKPTATATATPQPTPGVPVQGALRWEGSLYSDDDDDSETFAIGGKVRIKLYWSNHDDIELEVDSESGQRVLSYEDDGREHHDYSRADFWLTLQPGRYRFTLSGDYSGETKYRVEIEWGSN